MKTLTLVCFTCLVFLSPSSSEPASTTPSSANASTTTTVPSTTTTQSPKLVCAQKSNTSCSDCLAAGTGCYFCSETRRCGYYPYRKIIPSHDECASFSEVYWGVCFISLQATVITISVVVALLLISITVCCCVCCRKRNKRKWMREMAHLEDERKERQQRSEGRRAERRMKTDEIRKKYGLVKDDTPYTRI
ncbi:pituitary tumor-transforming gene 1 protein-interacting protein-like isoform X2 [Ornithodoros turicata]|uniref:pituitary tumor-transforming gene 1 protein-interacting protein-like isoform X2 n=1 Tax=Ornithodoros turicata TaxID=34597 RepID=UPI003138EA01